MAKKYDEIIHNTAKISFSESILRQYVIKLENIKNRWKKMK